MIAKVKASVTAFEDESAEARIAGYDWRELSAELSKYGCAIIKGLLSHEECQQMASLYLQEGHFRSHIRMAQHGFGKGEYRYFKYPLPDLLDRLRTALYPRLAAVANDWNERMGIDQRYPARHSELLKLCHDAGQTKPTPLLLQYVPGDFNCLHQDLYGELAFPLQVAILLSEPGRDFTGGEFCPGRTASAHAKPSRSCAPQARRRRCLRGSQSASSGQQRELPCQPTARCGSSTLRSATYSGNYFP